MQSSQLTSLKRDRPILLNIPHKNLVHAAVNKLYVKFEDAAYVLLDSKKPRDSQYLTLETDATDLYGKISALTFNDEESLKVIAAYLAAVAYLSALVCSSYITKQVPGKNQARFFTLVKTSLKRAHRHALETPESTFLLKDFQTLCDELEAEFKGCKVINMDDDVSIIYQLIVNQRIIKDASSILDAVEEVVSKCSKAQASQLYACINVIFTNNNIAYVVSNSIADRIIKLMDIIDEAYICEYSKVDFKTLDSSTSNALYDNYYLYRFTILQNISDCYFQNSKNRNLNDQLETRKSLLNHALAVQKKLFNYSPNQYKLKFIASGNYSPVLNQNILQDFKVTMKAIVDKEQANRKREEEEQKLQLAAAEYDRNFSSLLHELATEFDPPKKIRVSKPQKYQPRFINEPDPKNGLDYTVAYEEVEKEEVQADFFSLSEKDHLNKLDEARADKNVRAVACKLLDLVDFHQINMNNFFRSRNIKSHNEAVIALKKIYECFFQLDAILSMPHESFEDIRAATDLLKQYVNDVASQMYRKYHNLYEKLLEMRNRKITEMGDLFFNNPNRNGQSVRAAEYWMVYNNLLKLETLPGSETNLKTRSITIEIPPIKPKESIKPALTSNIEEPDTL